MDQCNDMSHDMITICKIFMYPVLVDVVQSLGGNKTTSDVPDERHMSQLARPTMYRHRQQDCNTVETARHNHLHRFCAMYMLELVTQPNCSRKQIDHMTSSNSVLYEVLVD